MSKFAQDVVRICNEELAFFGGGKIKEYDARVYKRVGEYWDELAKTKHYEAWKGYNGRSDVVFKDKDKKIVKKNSNQPWSAAFISWVAKMAGAGSEFRYAPSHSVYIVRALREAAKPSSNDKFIARRHNKYTPKVGDLIACERRSDTDATFDNYIAFVAAKKFEAHCDFVVSVDLAKRELLTIGGNVGNTVATKKWSLDHNNHIGDHDPKSKKSNVICIIECLL